MTERDKQVLASIRREREKLERKVMQKRKRKGVCECLGQDEARKLHDAIPCEYRFDPLFINEERKFEQFIDSIY